MKASVKVNMNKLSSNKKLSIPKKVHISNT